MTVTAESLIDTITAQGDLIRNLLKIINSQTELQVMLFNRAGYTDEENAMVQQLLTDTKSANYYNRKILKMSKMFK